MRIVLIGQAAFGEAVLTRLLEQGSKVVGVFCPADRTPDSKNPLRDRARAASLPLFQPGHMRNPEVAEQLAELRPDLAVMAFVTDIVPLSLLQLPTLGSIQYHPSLLPRHRGGSALNWTIIQGDERAGLTIFWPDAGVDTGPILLQKEVAVDPDETMGALYFNKLFPLGVDAMAESVRLVEAGEAPKLPQNEAEATHEGLCGEAQAKVNWRLAARQLYNLIRGTNPSPGAHATLRGQKVKLFDCSLLPAAGGAAGEIIAIDERGILVAAEGGAILLRRVQVPGEAKVAAHEFAAQASIEVGECLT